MRRVLILDDEYGRAVKWARELNELFLSLGLEYEASALVANDVASNIEELSIRRKVQRQGGTKRASIDVDSADVLVIDYDLLNLDVIGPYVTGNDVAYLARCYSDCGAIIGVNQFDKRGATFDLTLLGHPKEFADVHLNGALLTAKGLWGGHWGDEFRPWSWPIIPKLVERLAAARVYVFDNLDAPALEVLGFGKTDIASFPARALAYLEYDPPENTIDAKDRGTPVDELLCRDLVHIRPGLRGRDVLQDGSEIARLVESRLRHWIDEIIAPEQQILIDLPHLVERLPGALSDPADEAAWFGVCSPCFGSAELLADSLRPLVRTIPLDVRPLVNWRELTRAPDTIGAIVEASKDVSRRCFAEDRSQFFAPNDCDEFVSELELSYPRRYLNQVATVDYQPATNLALA